MTAANRRTVHQRLASLKARLGHAFAVQPGGDPLTGEDIELLQRVADAVIRRHMAAPTLMFLESMGPMNFLGSQALHFLTPLVELACETRDLERLARLLERRDAIPRLIALIETRADAVRSGAGTVSPR